MFSLEQLNSIFDKLEEMRIRGIQFQGGEPTLHPHIQQILEEALSRGFEVSIETNASNIEAIENFLHEIHVTTSMDYWGEKQDHWRGIRGLFKKQLQFLIENENSTIRFTVMEDNEEDIVKMLSFGLALGRAVIGVPLKPTMNMEFFEEYRPTSNTMLEVFKHVLRFGHIYDLPTHIEHPCFNMWLNRLAHEQDEFSYLRGRNTICEAGKKFFSIKLPDGAIVPCIFFDDSKQIANIFAEDPEKILMKLDKIELKSKGKCAECELNLLCSGCYASFDNSECPI